MSDSGRLQRESPELAALIDDLPAAERGPAVRRVIEQVAELTGVAADCRASDDLRGLVGRLDEQAWDLQEAGKSAEYEYAFGRARAAHAWMIGASSDSAATCHEAMYEALHAAKASGIDIASLIAS